MKGSERGTVWFGEDATEEDGEDGKVSVLLPHPTPAPACGVHLVGHRVRHTDRHGPRRRRQNGHLGATAEVVALAAGAE